MLLVKRTRLVAEFEPEIISGLKSLAKRELARLKSFAADAENPFESDSLAFEIQKRLNAMKLGILKAEKENLKLQKSDSEMVELFLIRSESAR